LHQNVALHDVVGEVSKGVVVIGVVVGIQFPFEVGNPPSYNVQKSSLSCPR